MSMPRCQLWGRMAGLSSASRTSTSQRAVQSPMSVEVPDVDDAYQRAQDNGAEIVDRLQDEDWGVRRFFLRTSAGHAMNELSHRG